MDNRDGPNIDINGDGSVVNSSNSSSLVFKPLIYLTQVIDEKIFKRLGIEQRFGFVIVAILVIGVGAFLFFALRPQISVREVGDFYVAVAGFTENGGAHRSQIGVELARYVSDRLQDEFDTMGLDFKVIVLGLNGEVDSITGRNREERAAAAKALAEELDADMVVYGDVDTSGTFWQVTPEFYLAPEDAYEADEVIGQYEIGEPFEVRGGGKLKTRVDLNDKLNPRVAILSQITVGLARYSLQEFESALDTFESTLNQSDEIGVNQVLYLLMGNAAGKLGELDLAELDLAESYHQKSLELDSEYARPYVGLAGVYYLRSLSQFFETEDPADIDVLGLHRAVETYQQALVAKNQPPLSDISTKVHFGLGQCYTMLVYAGEADFFDPAIEELTAVIEEYGEGANPRMQERAAESHGRLGLIYALSGHDAEAIAEYEKAASLLETYPERQEVYLDRAQKLREVTTSQSDGGAQ